MAIIKDEDLFKDIKAGIISPIYFLYGQEKYFLEQAVIQLRKKVVDKSFESFNLNIVEGEKLDLSQLEDMTDALPMMSAKRLILLKDVDFDKLKKDEVDSFYSILNNLSDTTVFVIYQGLTAVEMKKPSRYKKLVDTVSKKGVVCEFKFKDKVTLKRKLCERARKSHIELDMPVAEMLIDRCSSSYISLINELDKLISYVGEGEITKQNIEECSIKSIDSSAFDLAKNILSNNFDGAYRLLDELLYQRQEMIAVLAAVAMAFSDIYKAKLGSVCKKSAEQTAIDFDYPQKRIWAVKNAYRDIRSFSIEHIRYCISALYDADIALKSSKMDNRMILEKMLGQMFLMSINQRVI